MSQKKIYYTQEEFDADMLRMAEWARERNFSNVYGIPRGGVPVAQRLSELLNIPRIEDVQNISGTTLIVDDIVDTGRTVEFLRLSFHVTSALATLWSVVNPKVRANFSAHTKREDEGFVVFPWESDDEPERNFTLQNQNPS